jgi:hypothetical protein
MRAAIQHQYDGHFDIEDVEIRKSRQRRAIPGALASLLGASA